MKCRCERAPRARAPRRAARADKDVDAHLVKATGACECLGNWPDAELEVALVAQVVPVRVGCDRRQEEVVREGLEADAGSGVGLRRTRDEQLAIAAPACQDGAPPEDLGLELERSGR